MAILIGNAGDNTLTGGTENDYIQGKAGHDLLIGNEGDDSIEGNAGADTVYGGSGNDYIDTAAGGDRVFAGSGNDVIFSGAGSDAVYGEEGADTINGGAGNDVLSGGDGDDYIDRNAGNDYLIGGNGADTLVGGAGNDRIFGDELVEPNAAVLYNLPAHLSVDQSGADHVYAGQGEDIVVYDIEDVVYDGGEGFDVIRSYGLVDLSATTRNTVDGPLRARDSGFDGPVTSNFEAIQLKGIDDTVIMHAWNSQDTFDLTPVTGPANVDHRAVIGNNAGVDKIVVEVNGTISSFGASSEFANLSAFDQAGIAQLAGGLANIDSYQLVYSFGVSGSHTFHLHTAGIELLEVVNTSGAVLATYDFTI